MARILSCVRSKIVQSGHSFNPIPEEDKNSPSSVCSCYVLDVGTFLTSLTDTVEKEERQTMSNDRTGFVLGGPQPSLKRSHRLMGENLFIAARPDRAAAAAAQSIARDYRDLYRIDRQPLSDRGLHVSLAGLEHAPVLDGSLVHDARAAIDGVRFEPFEIRFDSVVSLRSRASRPIALAATERNPMLRSVVLRMADTLDGLGALPSGFHEDSLVHMTLIYYDKPVMPEHLSRPISWIVDQLWLVRNLVGQGTYEFLWPPEKLPDA
jgi:2'-5' RNA ligase